jgi:hypothetical protein
MSRLENGTVILDAVYPAVAEAADATRAYLLSRPGADEWKVGVAMAGPVAYDRAWWSDTYNGFTHDCALHTPEESSPETCYPDRRQVTIANGQFGGL